MKWWKDWDYAGGRREKFKTSVVLGRQVAWYTPKPQQPERPQLEDPKFELYLGNLARLSQNKI